jgi:hypothetical protein
VSSAHPGRASCWYGGVRGIRAFTTSKVAPCLRGSTLEMFQNEGEEKGLAW